MRHLLVDILMFFLGFLIALFTVSVMRLGDSAFSLVQLPIIALVLVVFFLKENRLAAFAVGLGLGLDAVSSYAFFTWTVIIGGTAFAGRWLSKAVVTNRSLPSLMLLGAAMRIAYFLLELVVSRLSGLVGGTVWYLVTGINVARVFAAFGIEMLFLLIFYMVYVRIRGERARMLTHL